MIVEAPESVPPMEEGTLDLGRPKPQPPQKHPPAHTSRKRTDPDLFLRTAKRLVYENYNSARDPDNTVALTADNVYIVSFSKVARAWTATVASSVIYGFRWEVTYTGGTGEASIEVYKKVTSVKVPVRGKKS